MAVHPEEHLLLYTPDHEDRAKGLLLWQFKDKPRLNAFVEALGAGAQILEDTLWATLIGTSTVQGSEGVHLDRWGELVGEHRGGLSNEEYRRFIALRLLANKAFPNEDLFWRLVDGAVPDSATVRTFRLYPAALKAIVYSYDWVGGALQAHTAALLRDARPAGVMWVAIETVPGHMALYWPSIDWEPDAPVIPSLAGASSSKAFISSLIYTGRGPR